MAPKGPGEAFEATFRASIPRGTYVRRLRTPTAMGFVVPKLVALIEQLSAALGVAVPEWATRARRFRFTPKAGFDLLLTAPAALAEPLDVEYGRAGAGRVVARPQVVLALELKSVEGGNLPFGNVDPDQERALQEAAAAGHLALLVVEFRRAGEVWAIPVQAWRQIRAGATRKSLPLAEARLSGMPILTDPFRGSANLYLDLAEWIVRCGGMLPESAAPKPRRAARGSAPAVPVSPEPAAPGPPRGLFDPPPDAD